MNHSKVNCVIFDCDGTLIDSERLCCEALCFVISLYGMSMSQEEAMTHFEGGKLADILSATCQRIGLNVSIDELEPLYRNKLEELFCEKLTPMNGALDLLRYLEEQGIDYCIASNGPKDKIEESLKITGLLQYFNGKVFSAFEANSWKPEPDLIQYSAMNMGYSLSECLYIDDTPKGIEAGLRSGVRTLQLIGSYTQQSDEDAICIRNLTQVIEYL